MQIERCWNANEDAYGELTDEQQREEGRIVACRSR